MARFLQAPDGAFPADPADFPPQSPLMTLQDWAALASAPRRPMGTEVTVQAKPIPMLLGTKDHMFVQFDDGRDPRIARGNPSKGGLGMVTGWLDSSDRVSARVDPAQQSPDYGAGTRTLARTFIPGVTSGQAAAPALQHAHGVDRGGNAYGWNSNSNSYAADVAEPIFGWRPGDDRTPGYRTHLRDDGPPPAPRVDFLGPLRPYDLTPAIRNPPL